MVVQFAVTALLLCRHPQARAALGPEGLAGTAAFTEPLLRQATALPSAQSLAELCSRECSGAQPGGEQAGASKQSDGGPPVMSTSPLSPAGIQVSLCGVLAGL